MTLVIRLLVMQERALNELSPDGFHHYEQSLRVVDILEKDGKGLDLTEEVRDGILKHTNMIADTKEGYVVRFAYVIAYINHDIAIPFVQAL